MADLVHRHPETTRRTSGGWHPIRWLRDHLAAARRATVPSATAAPAPKGGGIFGAFSPRFDLKETDDAFAIVADVPGLSDQDLEVSVTPEALTVSGERILEHGEDQASYHAWERAYGSFRRTFALPPGVDADRITAELRDGVLTIIVPKPANWQRKRIPVSSGT
jgi:HSP20 family protein